MNSTKKELLLTWASSVVVLVFLNFPAILVPSMPSADDLKMFHPQVTHECCTSAWDTSVWLYMGRGFGGFIVNLQSSLITNPRDLPYMRILSILTLALLLTFISRLFVHYGLSKRLAFLIGLGITQMPGFQLGIGWGHAFAFLICGPLLSYLSGFYYVKVFQGKRRALTLFISAVFLILGFYTYQAASVFFFLPVLVLALLSPNSSKELSILRYLAPLVWFYSIAAFYFAFHKTVMVPYYLRKHPHLPSGAYQFKISDMSFIEHIETRLIHLYRSFVSCLHFWDVYRTNILSVCILSISIFLIFKKWKTNPPQWNISGITRASFIVLYLISSFFVVIVSIASYDLERVMMGPKSILWVFLAITLVKQLGGFRNTEGERRSFICLCLITIPIAFFTSFNANIMAFGSHETLNYIGKNLSSSFRGKRFETIHVIQKDRSDETFLGLPITDEFTRFDVNKESISIQMSEMHYPFNNIDFCYRDYTEADSIFMFPNDVLIDLRGINKQMKNMARTIEVSTSGLNDFKSFRQALTGTSIADWRPGEAAGGKIVLSPRTPSCLKRIDILWNSHPQKSTWLILGKIDGHDWKQLNFNRTHENVPDHEEWILKNDEVCYLQYQLQIPDKMSTTGAIAAFKPVFQWGNL